MNVDCTLTDSHGRRHRVMALIIWSRLCHFPRMVARIEGKIDARASPFTFSLQSATNDVAALKTLAQSRWHLHRCSSQSSTHQTLLELGPDPSAHLQVQPFASNAARVEDLVRPLLHPTGMRLVAPEDAPKIESLVSCGETLEQFASRLSRLTNSVYRVKPTGPDTWSMEWAASLSALSKGVAPYRGSEIVSTEAVLEAGLQRVGIPTDAAAELLLTGDEAFSETDWQPVQLGWAGPDAVNFESPRNENGQALGTLRSEWNYLTDLGQVPLLWRGERMHLADDPRSANVLASVFIYGESEKSLSVCKAIEQVLGGRDHHQENQGWVCAALTVKPDHTPRSIGLVQRLLEDSRFDDCLSGACQAIDLPQPLAHKSVPAAPYRNLPAIVIKNPLSPEKGPLSRTKDGMQYRTKIWVQILGVRGALEVDWAIPFASHDNTSTGGTLGGDHILVPSEFTYGFVSWIEAGCRGAPFFFATTHYRDAPVSDGIGKHGFTHGLVTNNGLLIHERSTDFDIAVRDTWTTSALNYFDRSGNGN